ncbi:SNF2 family amine-terminal domain protein [Toxoplasma gondii GAB2-2007-GAL-DOM2]|uniref:SNF2 family amine-terminal domain protein n=1 Tax=Toxoplasma gondii GAB2-2007-GAL-DOM2 TaxID=1130820 RepID=A0A086KJC4_TOXGO|nr:SNF2 family amine-terminal domain protein [Toxoplasma gondii GAB2-2007-GAL-DOM2]
MARALSSRFRWCVSGTPLLHATSACSSGFCENFLGPQARDAGGKNAERNARNLHLPKELAGLLSTLQLDGPDWMRDSAVLQQVFQPLSVGLPWSLILPPPDAQPCSHAGSSSSSLSLSSSSSSLSLSSSSSSLSLSSSSSSPSLSSSSSSLSLSSCSSCASLAWITRRQRSSWSRQAAPAWLPPERAWGRASSRLYSLVDLLYPLFWRTNMKDVMGELGVPPPIVHNVFVEFGPVERVFYQHQQLAVRQKSASLLSFSASSSGAYVSDRDWETAGASAHTREGKKSVSVTKQLDSLLLTLRQACQHPQLGQLGLKKRRGRAETGDSVVFRREVRRRCRGRRGAGNVREPFSSRPDTSRHRQGLAIEDEADRRLRDLPETDLATEFMLMDDVLSKLIHEAKARDGQNVCDEGKRSA